jgi:virginiamycin B lyase
MVNLGAVRRPITSLSIVARISIAGFPDWVGIDEENDAVWISNRDRNDVARIDQRTNRLITTIPVGRRPCCGLAVGYGSLWVPSCADRTVSRVDPLTNRVVATIPIGPAASEGAIVSDRTGVWLPSDPQGKVTRIDPIRNTVATEIPVPAASFAVMSGFGAIWATCTSQAVVSRIDPAANTVVASIRVGPSPRFLTAGFGAIWVLNQGDGTLSQIDPTTNQVAATIELDVPGEGGDIDVGCGAVWVTAPRKPLSRIDPQAKTVTAQYVGEGGDALRIGFGSIWLCNFGLQELWRIDPAQI